MSDAQNPLTLLPAKTRHTLYVGYGILGIAAGATQVGYASLDGVSQPDWLTVALAVIGFLAIPFAALAATNTRPSGAEAPVDLAGNPDVVAYQTESGLIVAGEASPIPTGTPVEVNDPDDDLPQFGDAPVAPTPEFPEFNEDDPQRAV